MRNAEILATKRKSGSRNTMVTSDFSPEVEIRPVRACAMHPAIIIGTVRSLWTWLWGRYHVPQNAFLVLHMFCCDVSLSSEGAHYGSSTPIVCGGRHTAELFCRSSSTAVLLPLDGRCRQHYRRRQHVYRGFGDQVH